MDPTNHILFAGPVTHDILDDYDVIDIFDDVVHLQIAGSWRHGVPDWCQRICDELMTQPAMVVSVAVMPWLLDKALTSSAGDKMRTYLNYLQAIGAGQ